MSDTTEVRGACGHDWTDFIVYSTHSLDEHEAPGVETQAAGCDLCWTELASLIRLWGNISRGSPSNASGSGAAPNLANIVPRTRLERAGEEHGLVEGARGRAGELHLPRHHPRRRFGIGSSLLCAEATVEERCAKRPVD
jgi:hypothetical protein